MITLLSSDTILGERLIQKFGPEIGNQIIDMLREEGLPIEFPATITNGILMSSAPKMHLEFLDRSGKPLTSKSNDVAMKHRWCLKINDQIIPYVKSVEIPKLDYRCDENIVFRVDLYGVGKPL